MLKMEFGIGGKCSKLLLVLQFLMFVSFWYPAAAQAPAELYVLVGSLDAESRDNQKYDCAGIVASRPERDSDYFDVKVMSTINMPNAIVKWSTQRDSSYPVLKLLVSRRYGPFSTYEQAIDTLQKAGWKSDVAGVAWYATYQACWQIYFDAKGT